VTVFERRRLAGGLNATGVAPYKMHVEGAMMEVDFIRSLGVAIREGVEVGRDLSASDLLRDFDAVFIGVGLGADAKLGIPGEDGPDVVGATAWIERLKLEPGFRAPEGKRAIVIGGGNTAIDATRELARLGAAEVTMLYRRSVAEMPGYAHEMDMARKEGVRLMERAVPKEFVRDAGGQLVALRLANGLEVGADFAVLAIGQARLRELISEIPGVALDPKGCIVVDEATGRTGHPKVYAGGDALGGELVVTAAQDAKRAARAMCAAIGARVRADSPMNAGHR
jgi:dihydropyrimidine dehydrogenase (NAD+) subunit PreT